MNTQDFFQTNAGISRVDFKQNFADVIHVLALESKLSAFELSLLHRAAFRAALCNIAFNGRGGCAGWIKPEREDHRRNLEITFMSARNCIYASDGWAALDRHDQSEIKRRLLAVGVSELNLAS
jgi:hypothetical protein